MVPDSPAHLLSLANFIRLLAARICWACSENRHHLCKGHCDCADKGHV